MMLSVLAATAAISTLPSLPGVPPLPGAPSLPGGGSTRPGPANKGIVEWVSGLPVVPTQEVNTQSSVEDAGTSQKYVGIPDWLHWSTAHFLSDADAGKELRLSCPTDSGDNVPCTFYVVLYNCIPCSTSTNGGLPTALLSDGFEAGSCGPKYVPLPGAEVYPTAIYKKELAPGTEITETLARHLMHAVVFELSIAQQCSLVDSLVCSSNSNCMLLNGQCVDLPMCPKPFKQGPKLHPAQQCKCLPTP